MKINVKINDNVCFENIAFKITTYMSRSLGFQRKLNESIVQVVFVNWMCGYYNDVC